MRPVTWNGETLAFLPERAVWWEREQALLIADPHFGKSGTFRALGVPVPSGITADDLARLEAAVHRTGARRLLILGDFFHAKAGRSEALHAALDRWRGAHPTLDVVLVRGNHDRHAGDPHHSLAIRCVHEPFEVGGILMRHHPLDTPEAVDAPVIAGHMHPVAVLRDPTGLRHRLPCFWVGPRQLVLPAFGSFTGGLAVPARPGDRVFVVADDDVLEAGAPP